MPDLLPTTPLNALQRRGAAWGLAALMVAGAALLPRATLAQGMCPGEPLCRDTGRFTATVVDFRVSPNTSGNRPLSLTVRFSNKTGEALILGYVNGTAAAYDDRGHKYQLQNSRKLQGIGMIERQRFDPKFTLGPGESADARLELNFYAKGVVVGTAFDVEMGVREIERLPGQQYRLGREHALSWQSLGQGAGAAAPAAPTAPTAPSTAVAPGPSPTGDACAGQPNCSASGPLFAQVVGLQSAAPAGNNHLVTLRLSFRNLGDAPMILNYKQSTGEMLDERGEKYMVDSRYRESVQGMPVATRERASSQFTLQPGEARTAAFVFRRFVGRVPPGTAFSPALAVEQYTLLPSNQLQLVREHSLNFGTVQGGLGAPNLGDALKTLSDLLNKR
jgi:hypothetical protein